jgi:hypothetical protein
MSGHAFFENSQTSSVYFASLQEKYVLSVILLTIIICVSLCWRHYMSLVIRSIYMLSVVILNDVMLTFVILNDVMLSVVILSDIMLSVVILSDTMLSNILYSLIMMSVVVLIVCNDVCYYAEWRYVRLF